MPLYEFRCRACGRAFTDLVGMTAEPPTGTCPHCGAADIQKLVSRVGRFRTEDDRIDELADRLETMGEPESPTAMRELAKEMGRAMDEDMADEMEAMFEDDASEPEAT